MGTLYVYLCMYVKCDASCCFVQVCGGCECYTTLVGGCAIALYASCFYICQYVTLVLLHTSVGVELLQL